MTISRRPRPNRLCRLENLEQRTLMAGDVMVTLSGDVLNIAGDHQDNTVTVSSPSEGGIKVAGVGDTTVNGSDAVYLSATEAAEIVDIVIQMDHGDDDVSLWDLDVPGNAVVDLGESDNADRAEQLHLNNSTVHGDLTLLGRQGRQHMNIHNDVTVGGDLLVDVGKGSDWIQISDLEVTGNATLRGDAPERVLLDRVRVSQALSIVVGDSGLTAVIQVKNSWIGSDLAIFTDAGDDRVTIESTVVGGNMSIATGAGSDFVMFSSQNQIGGSLLINTGQTKDGVLIGDTLLVGSDVLLDGGNGMDVLSGEELISLGGNLTIDGLETQI